MVGAVDPHSHTRHREFLTVNVVEHYEVFNLCFTKIQFPLR